MFRRMWWLRSAVPLVVAAWLAPASVAAMDRLIWIVIGSEPAADAADHDPAPQDAAADWLIAHIPGFDHRKLYANIPRALALAKDGDGFCIPELKLNDRRAEILEFSRVMGWSVADRLFVRRASLAQFAGHRDRDGRVVLRSLVADGAIKGAREAAAHMGPRLEAELSGSSAEIVPRFGNAVRMLAAGRFDWLIADPAKTRGLIEDLPDPGAIVTLPIAEDSGLEELYVACSKREVGQRAIRAVNAALDQVTAPPVWERAHVDALDEASRREYEFLRGSPKTR